MGEVVWIAQEVAKTLFCGYLKAAMCKRELYLADLHKIGRRVTIFSRVACSSMVRRRNDSRNQCQI